MFSLVINQDYFYYYNCTPVSTVYIISKSVSGDRLFTARNNNVRIYYMSSVIHKHVPIHGNKIFYSWMSTL